MKRAIILFCAAFIASTLMGANDKYIKKMSETISQFSTCSSIEDFQDLANKFRVIANVETKEWLPLYYEAHCYIMMSFMDRTGAERKDGYLDQANASVETMLELAPGESEAYALQALYYTGRLLVNPPQRAQTTAPLVSAAVGRALGLDPNNPRAKYISLRNEIGTAQFFGSDTTPYCKSARELLDGWDSYTLESGIHPTWGKNLAEQIVNACIE